MTRISDLTNTGQLAVFLVAMPGDDFSLQLQRTLTTKRKLGNVTTFVKSRCGHGEAHESD